MTLGKLRRSATSMSWSLVVVTVSSTPSGSGSAGSASIPILDSTLRYAVRAKTSDMDHAANDAAWKERFALRPATGAYPSFARA